MQAVVWTKYGPPEVLQPGEVDRPSPKAGEVLIKVHAASVTAGDCEMRGLTLPRWVRLPMRLYVGFSEPKRITILGQELAGEIVEVGKDVTLFRPGDQVFAATGMRFGSYAEYTCIPAASEDGALALKPANLSYAEAAVLPVGGLEALHFVQAANLRSGERILINGAGGSIGTAAIQLAKERGAEVTGVDSKEKLDTLTTLGADHVIDYAQQDFTRNGERYDVILDVVGNASMGRCIKSLKPNGRYLSANPRVSTMVQGWWASKTSDKRVIMATSDHRTESLNLIRELAEAGKLKPVVDRSYPLAQVAEAHRYVESGRKRGSVAITVPHEGEG